MKENLTYRRTNIKASEIKIGNVYLAKVTNQVVPVRIDEESPHGGWTATNLRTSKAVRIKTAGRLQREVTKEELKKGTAPGMDKTPLRRARKKAPAKSATQSVTSKQATSTKASKSGATRANVAKPTAKLSGLDAAYQVLCESDEPLNSKQIVETAAEKGYWKSDAATPHATIHAAISREIKMKGAESRFIKAERGRFAAK